MEQIEQGEAPKDLVEAVSTQMLNRERILECLIFLIITQNLAFSIVESDEFRAFIASINPYALGYIPKSHTTIRDLIKSRF